MDKQKQIRDKLIKVIKKQCICCNGNDCDKCCYDGDDCVEERLADAIIDSNAVIPENAVVLTDEDEIKKYNWSKMLDKMGFFKFADNLRKETAEKFAERLLEKAFIEFTDCDYDRLCFLVGAIAKEITEGMNGN